MHREVWLRANRRVAAAAALAPGLLLAAAWWGWLRSDSVLAGWPAWLLGGAALSWLGWFLAGARRPRLACDHGQLAVYLRGARPICVPLEVVECFFLGQAPARLPGSGLISQRRGLETVTLIVRLAESATEWKHQDVHPWLGQWCEGYITIRGTFTEPLRGELVARLNRRLVEARRAARGTECGAGA